MIFKCTLNEDHHVFYFALITYLFKQNEAVLILRILLSEISCFVGLFLQKILDFLSIDDQ